MPRRLTLGHRRGPRPVSGRVVSELVERGLTVAVAESLTGGALTAELVAVPGTSQVLRGGVVAYMPDVKAGVLGVDPALLAAGGPVQPQVAAQMAAGVRHLLGADSGVATTGVAGPGPDGDVPAGVVYVCATLGRQTRVRRLRLAGTRGLVREASVTSALALLWGLLVDSRRAGEQIADRSR